MKDNIEENLEDVGVKLAYCGFDGDIVKFEGLEMIFNLTEELQTIIDGDFVLILRVQGGDGSLFLQEVIPFLGDGAVVLADVLGDVVEGVGNLSHIKLIKIRLQRAKESTRIAQKLL